MSTIALVHVRIYSQKQRVEKVSSSSAGKLQPRLCVPGASVELASIAVSTSKPLLLLREVTDSARAATVNVGRVSGLVLLGRCAAEDARP